MIPLTFTFTLLSLLSLARAHPPIERLDELIDGLSDECVCDPACTTIVETECTDIQCACNLQLQAQQCVVSCERTSAAVGAFNAYLDSCVKESLALPTATLPVIGLPPSSSIPAAYVQTQVQSQQGTSVPNQPQAGGSMGYDDAGAGGAGAGGANWLEVGSANTGRVTTAAAALQTAGYASGGPSASGLSLTNYTNPNNGPSVGAATSGVASGAGTTSTSTTAALDATNLYFTQAVSEDCQVPCQCWKDAADACTDDTCLCTPDAFQYARECNECVGSSRAGMNARNVGDLPSLPWSTDDDEMDDQGPASGGGSSSADSQQSGSGTTNPSMGFHYSKFTEACQAKVPGIANGAAGLQQGKGGVEVVPSGLGYATDQARAGKGGQPIMLTDAYGQTQYAEGAGGGGGGRGGYSTNIVTATAAAMYAQETVIVEDESGFFDGGAFSRQSIAWELLLSCLALSLVCL